MVSVRIRHVILGAASREERAGSDRKSGELQTMPFSQETVARLGAKLLDRRQWNTREMRHIDLRSVVKTRTFCGIDSLETIFIAQCM